MNTPSVLVPEAAMDEYHGLVLRQNDIRLSGQSAGMEPISKS
jgi:hypothetical protein